MFNCCDALRRPERFEGLLLACECDARGRTGFEEAPYLQRDRLLRALALVRSVDTAAIAAQAQERGWSGPAIGAAITAARHAALERIDAAA